MTVRPSSSRPFVTVNFAITADGRISTRKRTPSDFSSPADKRRLLEIRAQSDAVLVGARTITADNMTLGLPPAELREARVKAGKPPFPLRVIVSNSGRMDASGRVFTAGLPSPVIFSTRRMTRRQIEALAPVSDLWLHLADRVNLADALASLREDYGVRKVVCEGGGTLLKELLTAGLVDELHLTCCPVIFGGKRAPTLTGLPGDFLPRSTRLKLVDFEPSGRECFTRWRVMR